MDSAEEVDRASTDLSNGAEPEQRPLVAVVGPCASGKSVLVETLRARGINSREVAQEHSYIPDMWRRITGPDLLIFLDVSLEASLSRRPTNINESAWQDLNHRLDHAREHADLLINTDLLSPQEVVDQTLTFLRSQGIHGQEISTD